jgi:hypothetical protein
METPMQPSTADRGVRWAAMLAMLALALPQLVCALINPKYTVVDLVRDSGRIAVLRVSAPNDGLLRAEVVEVLAGEAGGERTLTFDVSDAQDLSEDDVTAAFGGADTAPAVMCVVKRLRDGVPAGALEIGTKWMGIALDKAAGRWKLDSDQQDLETVWAGSARALAPAIRYALADPAAAFPVTADLTWARDASPGTLLGPGTGALQVALGDGLPAVVVLSGKGDRVYQSPAKCAPLKDITRDLGLTSASKAMAAGDFNGDGRVDLASWDGAKVRLFLRGADGRFAKPAGDLPLVDMRSLAAVAMEKGLGLIAGCGGGIAVLAPDGKGGLLLQKRIAADAMAELGAGGVCAVADFNDDGALDVVQAFSEGLVRYDAVLKADAPQPVTVAMKTVAGPACLVTGDFDTDGQLDLAVGGPGGMAVLARDSGGVWRAMTRETGELGAAVGTGDGIAVCALSPSDVNGDGRQGLAMFSPGAAPSLFFNRGFACFGICRTLTLGESELKGAGILGNGQSTGLVADVDGDGAQDLLGADPKGAVWTLYGKATAGRRTPVTVTLADAARGPLTVTALMGGRRLGLWIVRPGEPAVIGVPKAGRLTLQWKGADGALATRELVVAAPTAVAL